MVRFFIERPVFASTGGYEIQVEDLAGRGPQALNEAVQALLAEAKRQPEFNAQQIFTTFSTSTPQYEYDLGRPKAKLGLSLPDMFNTLQIYLGSLTPHVVGPDSKAERRLVSPGASYGELVAVSS